MILSALLVAASLSFDVVRDGVPACSVVASGDRSVDAAAAFFTNAVYRMSGVEVKIVRSRSEVEVEEEGWTSSIRRTSGCW